MLEREKYLIKIPKQQIVPGHIPQIFAIALKRRKIKNNRKSKKKQKKKKNKITQNVHIYRMAYGVYNNPSARLSRCFVPTFLLQFS